MLEKQIITEGAYISEALENAVNKGSKILNTVIQVISSLRIIFK